jgi:hypothetical protein
MGPWYKCALGENSSVSLTVTFYITMHLKKMYWTIYIYNIFQDAYIIITYNVCRGQIFLLTFPFSNLRFEVHVTPICLYSRGFNRILFDFFDFFDFVLVGLWGLTLLSTIFQLYCGYGSWIYNYLCNRFLSPLML